MNNLQDNNQNGSPQEVNYIRFFIAVICFAVGVILLGLAIGLAFAVAGVSIYLILASMIVELASISFTNAQKRIDNTKANKIIKIVAYAAMVIAVIFVVVGATVTGLLK